MSLYTDLIQQVTKCTEAEAPLVEAYMRQDFHTLDHLDRAWFAREARRCLKDVRLDPQAALECARYFGLVPQVPPVKPALPQLGEIVSVYSGRAGACACGCKGKHYYASARVDEGSADRGYPVKADEVSDRMVKQVLGRFQRAEPSAVDALSGESVTIYSMTVGARMYVIYARKPQAAEVQP